MTQTVTLNLEPSVLEKLKYLADQENRTLANFIELATLRYMEQIEFADFFEMEDIVNDAGIMKRLKKGSEDARNLRGQFVE